MTNAYSTVLTLAPIWRTALRRTFSIAAVTAIAVSASVMGWTQSAQAQTSAVEAAKLRAEKLMNAKIEWHGPTSALKPIAGKRLAVISCCQAAEGAARPARGIVEAGKLLGWKVDIFDGKGDPMEQNKALNAAVDSKYDGIALIYIDTPVVSEGVARALSAKIPLITMGAMKNTPESIPDISHDFVGIGRAIADYMIWKSNGKVNALLLKNTDLKIVIDGQYKGTFEGLNDKKQCPDCKVVAKDWSLANLDTQPAALASAALQADPNINWVWCFDACMARVSRTMVASGLGTKVKGAGFDCNAENVQLIKDGQVQTVCAADPREWASYGMVDNLNRMMQGKPAVAQNIPVRMFDKSTIGALSESEVKNGWQGDFDFRAKYKSLWAVK